MRLETERLVLRKPTLDDLDGYAELWGDAEVVRYLSGTTLPRDEVPRAIERMLGQWERHGVGLFSVLRKEDDQFVGRFGYLLWDPERWVNAITSSSTVSSSSRSAGPSSARSGATATRPRRRSACRDHALARARARAGDLADRAREHRVDPRRREDRRDARAARRRRRGLQDHRRPLLAHRLTEPSSPRVSLRP